MRLARWCSVAACLAVSAAKAEPPRDVSSVDARVLAAAPGDTILFIRGDQISTARVDRVSLTGRRVRLLRSGSKVRGSISSADLAFELESDRVNGNVAGRRVALDVARAEGGLTISGQFGSRAIMLQLSVHALNGDIGPCHYELASHGNDYSGQVACGGLPARVQLRFPSALTARGDVELAAMLTAFLAA